MTIEEAAFAIYAGGAATPSIAFECAEIFEKEAAKRRETPQESPSTPPTPTPALPPALSPLYAELLDAVRRAGEQRDIYMGTADRDMEKAAMGEMRVAVGLANYLRRCILAEMEVVK